MTSTTTAAIANPLSGLERTVGKDVFDKIQTCNILVVGSGGIGCELLKDLALSGFRKVEVIDLDTIDVSNLNRQLLFRSQHVGMAKCTVACQVASAMVPSSPTPPTTTSDKHSNKSEAITYVAHHGNVCDTTQFNVPFLKTFDLVLNALDNVEARRRVNRLCLAADTPLIEAGTTGYLGQVTVIHKESQVACYECNTQETQKVYPICTIRSTPSMPVHTIVWSKELYKLLFHSKVEESMLYEDPTLGEEENAVSESEGGTKENGGEAKEEGEDESGNSSSTYMEAVETVRTWIQSKNNNDNSNNNNNNNDNNNDNEEHGKAAIATVLQRLYQTEIQKQLDMGRYKAAKKTPTPLEATVMQEGMAMDATTTSATQSSSTTEIWSLSRCVAECVACIVQAKKEIDQNIPVLESFDKDNDLAMRFVTANSNLRSHVFGIEPLQSLYAAKGIAGNIIPAIATTNAICAGLQILQAFSILKQQVELAKDNEKKDKVLQLQDACCYVNCIRQKTRNGLYLTASKLEPPNPNCFVCRNATIPLALNVEEWTLELFLQKIVKQRLGFEHPTIMLEGDIVWEEGEGADEEEYAINLPKVLSKLPCGGIHHGTVIELDDVSQNLTIQVSVTHQDVWEKNGDEDVADHPFTVGAAPPKPQAAAKPAAAAGDETKAVANGNAADDDDDVVIVEDTEQENGDKEPAPKKDDDVVLIIDDEDEEEQKPPAKRPAEADTNGEPAAKKAKASDVIEIE